MKDNFVVSQTIPYFSGMSEYIGKALVGCEESQAVTKELRRRGWEAFSCDILDCSGGKPEWHIKGDIRNQLTTYYDLVIFHPPCTRLTNTGVCWLHKRNLWADLDAAAAFFNLRHEFNSPLVATENPIPHKYAVAKIGRYTQIIHPHQHGHPESKATCLWLKGLPDIVKTNDVKAEMMALPDNQRQRLHYLPPSPDRAKLRSKTYPGIAAAMADQWTDYYLALQVP